MDYRMLQFFTPVPWVGQISFAFAPYLPLVSASWNKTMTWAAKTCDSRLAKFSGGKENSIDTISGERDAFARFIRQAARDNDLKSLDRLALYGDAFLITVAGSHTTALTLTMVSYELARNPELQKKLREEIVASGAVRLHPDGDMRFEKLDVATIDKLSFLNGCINEALRLYPAVPTGGIKQTVNKSITICGQVIPPETVIVAPRWSIGRSEYFSLNISFLAAQASLFRTEYYIEFTSNYL